MNRILSCLTFLLLLAGYVASGKTLEELDDEQIRKIAKSEIVA